MLNVTSLVLNSINFIYTVVHVILHESCLHAGTALWRKHTDMMISQQCFWVIITLMLVVFNAAVSDTHLLSCEYVLVWKLMFVVVVYLWKIWSTGPVPDGPISLLRSCHALVSLQSRDGSRSMWTWRQSQKQYIHVTQEHKTSQKRLMHHHQLNK